MHGYGIFVSSYQYLVLPVEDTFLSISSIKYIDTESVKI